jgi:hypothetical protein
MDHQEVGLGTWTKLLWLRVRTVVGTCEYGNEPLGSVKCEEFLN